MASFRAELARKEGEPGAAMGQLNERDLCSGSTDLYGISWRDVLAKPIFCFWFCYCFDLVVVVVFRCLAAWVLPSPFLAGRRPRCLIGGCLGATAGLGMVEDLVVAEDPPNMRNNRPSSDIGVHILYTGLRR